MIENIRYNFILFIHFLGVRRPKAGTDVGCHSFHANVMSC